MVDLKQTQRTNHFGESMREARKKADVKLGDLAGYLDVSVPFLSDVECGRRDPLSNERIVKVAKLLNIDITTLLEAAARDRGKIVIPIGAGDHNMKVRAATLLASNWLRVPQCLIEKIIQTLERS